MSRRTGRDNKGGNVLTTPDDLLWVAKPNIRDIFSIIYDPCYWAYKNVAVDLTPKGRAKSDKYRAYVKSNYSISFQATPETIAFGTDDIYLQGVHRTNILTLRVSSAVAQDFISRVLLGPALPDPSKRKAKLENPEYYAASAEERIKFDTSQDPPSADELIHYAQWLISTKFPDQVPKPTTPTTTPPPTTTDLVTALFGNRQTSLTIADRKKAYAHLQIAPEDSGSTKLSRELEERGLHLGPLVRRGDPDPNLVMSALFHLFAAASPTTVEEAFNANDPSNTELLWKTWVQDEQDWSPDSPGIIKRNCFQCMKSGPQPMTITGEGTDYSGCGDVLWTDDPCSGQPNQFQVLAAKYPEAFRDPELVAELTGGNEQICEMLVAEYDAGDTSVTWCEAFSKTYGG